MSASTTRLLGRRDCLRALASLAAPLCVSVPALAARPRLLRFTFSRRFDDPRTQWLIAVYREALASLGVGFEFLDVPAGRAPLAIEAGEADGELGRTRAYGDLYPSLVRVPEANNTVEFAVYAAGDSGLVDFPGWSAVRAQGLTCEHRRGIQELAALLAREAAPGHVSTVTTIEQGVRRLQLKRVALYFDVQEAVQDYLAFGDASPQVRAGPAPSLLRIVESTTGHAYLHRRHEALVPMLSDTLQNMKRQGIVTRLREDALQRFLAARTR
ncbi:hypothetical protein [Roseateles noduli]|uniref:hypothetical protein n=1 Tax=Roseateles noduli TaxID=2052484 RepID=UPI003D6533FC